MKIKQIKTNFTVLKENMQNTNFHFPPYINGTEPYMST